MIIEDKQEQWMPGVCSWLVYCRRERTMDAGGFAVGWYIEDKKEQWMSMGL